MLSVDVDEVVGHLAQLSHGGGAAVDPRAALALRIDRAPQQQGAITVCSSAAEARLVEPTLQTRWLVELGADLGSRRAFAHHACIAPAAERELQCIDQDRLAGAGLAGERREAALEVDLECGDDHEIAQGQSAQHRQLTPEFQCSLRRKVA